MSDIPDNVIEQAEAVNLSGHVVDRAAAKVIAEWAREQERERLNDHLAGLWHGPEARTDPDMAEYAAGWNDALNQVKAASEVLAALDTGKEEQ